MENDRKHVWIVEYAIGIIFLVAVMPFIVHPRPGWSDAHGWAYLLFIACSGIAFVSSASGTRQRLKLSERIKKLEQIIENQNSHGQDKRSESGQEHPAGEHRQVGVGSLN
jgi:hypothetical protein